MTDTAPIDTFLQTVGLDHATRETIAGDASARRYMRLHHTGQSYILMDARAQPNVIAPFIAAAEVLAARGLSSPEILANDPETGLLLTEDFGNTSLRHAIGHSDPQVIYAAVVDAVATMQDPAMPAPWPRTMANRLPEECTRFIEWYMPYAAEHPVSHQACTDFMDFWTHILAPSLTAPQVFSVLDMIHDNLFWLPDRTGHKRIGFIDIQDAVLGPAVYDLASLIYDVRCPVDPALRDHMIKQFADVTGATLSETTTNLVLWSTQRNFKILGTFVRLSQKDGKSGYLTHIPRVWSLIQDALAHPALHDMARWVHSEIPDKMQ